MKPQLTQTFYIPKDAKQTYRDDHGASVWEYDDGRARPAALAFHGAKQSKPDFHYIFRSAQSRHQYIKTWLESLHEQRKAKTTRKAQQTAPTSLKVGDILHGSWGYDQTQCDYFQVTGRKGARGVYVRPIAAETVPGSDGFMCDSRVPVKDAFTGPETYHIASKDGIKYDPSSDRNYQRNEDQINSGYKRERNYYASKWDGKPNYCSWYA